MCTSKEIKRDPKRFDNHMPSMCPDIGGVQLAGAPDFKTYPPPLLNLCRTRSGSDKKAFCNGVLIKRKMNGPTSP